MPYCLILRHFTLRLAIWRHYEHINFLFFHWIFLPIPLFFNIFIVTTATNFFATFSISAFTFQPADFLFSSITFRRFFSHTSITSIRWLIFFWFFFFDCWLLSHVFHCATFFSRFFFFATTFLFFRYWLITVFSTDIDFFYFSFFHDFFHAIVFHCFFSIFFVIFFQFYDFSFFRFYFTLILPRFFFLRCYYAQLMTCHYLCIIMRCHYMPLRIVTLPHTCWWYYYAWYDAMPLLLFATF